MSRWDTIWERAVDAAVRPDEPPVGLAALAADGDHAAALSVSDMNDVGRLLLLQRHDGSFAPWSEPVEEPLYSHAHLPSADLALIKWTVGPVKVVEAGRVVWAVAGELAEPVAAVGISDGQRLAMGSVHGRYFSAVHVGASLALAEICIYGFAADRNSEVWSVRMTAANEINELGPDWTS